MGGAARLTWRAATARKATSNDVERICLPITRKTNRPQLFGSQFILLELHEQWSVIKPVSKSTNLKYQDNQCGEGEKRKPGGRAMLEPKWQGGAS